MLLMAGMWLLMSLAPGMAQDVPYTQIMARKKAMFQRQLQLTPEEMKKFWPVYEEMDGALRKLAAEKKKLTIDIRQKVQEEGTDKELEALMDRYLKIEAERVAVKQKYYERFKSVLPIRKVIRIPVVERRFRKALLRRMRDRRGGPPGPAPRRPMPPR